MSLRLVAQEEIPVAFFMFDGTSPFTDHSGRGKTATSTATARHAALVKDASHSLIIGDTTRVTVDAPIYRKTFEHLPFSIEVAVRSIKKAPTNLAPQQIFGNAGQMDGLTIAGNVISFSTKYATTGEAKCSFNMQEGRAAFLDAVHTPAKNQLFLDGELVAEVEITAAQQADAYFSNGTTMSMGETTSGNLLAINGLSLYRNQLELDAIFQHYTAAMDNLSEAAVATAFGGANLDLSPEQSNPFVVQTYSSKEDWNSGYMGGTTTEYGQLVPSLDGGVSIVGEWLALIPLPQENGTLYGVTLNWEGEGSTVSTSLDATTWTSTSRGKRVSTIPSGFNPVGKSLYVKVSFPGGIPNDLSYLDNLAATIYLSGKLPDLDGRVVTLVATSVEQGTDVLEYNENYGAEMNAGSITVGPRGSNSLLPKTIEVWAKKFSSATFTDNLNTSSPTASYTNGTTLQSYQIDEWQLRTYVFNAGFSGEISFSGTGQIGTITIYPHAMTAEQAYRSYKSYTGIPSLSLSANDNIFITDIPDYVDIYAYDWSIESAG